MESSVKILVLAVTVVILCHLAQARLGFEQIKPTFSGRFRCRPRTPKQKEIELEKRGKGPLGAFNKNYMATDQRRAKAFPKLVKSDSASQTKIHRPIRANYSRFERNRRSFPQTTLGSCVSSSGKSCPSCWAVTDLGPTVIPRYVNEVVCKFQLSFCSGGYCENSVVPQTFLRLTGKCGGNGLDVLDEFVYGIKACCECFLF